MTFGNLDALVADPFATNDGVTDVGGGSAQSDIYTVERLQELKREKKHPTKGACYKY